MNEEEKKKARLERANAITEGYQRTLKKAIGLNVQFMQAIFREWEDGPGTMTDTPLKEREMRANEALYDLADVIDTTVVLVELSKDIGTLFMASAARVRGQIELEGEEQK